MTAVYRREIKSYFTGMTGAIFIAFLLLFTGIYTVAYNIRGLYPNFEYTLSGVAFIYLLAVPILTMRSVAEEKHSRTDQLLYSLPISVTEIVMAKYAAMLTVLAIPVAVMSFYPLLLTMFGTVHLSPAYASLLAFFLLGAALLAIGLFISSLTESQVIAAVISLGVMIFINLMPAIASLIPETASASLLGVIAVSAAIGLIVQVMIKNPIISVAVTAILAAVSVIVYIINQSVFAGLVPDVLNSLALFDRLSAFQNGIFDLTAVVYYISTAALFVFLTVQSMEKKRWN